VVRGQNAYLATDPVMGFDILSNVSGSANGIDQHNVESYAKRIPNQITTCWSAYSSLTENYYLVDLHGYRVAEVSIGKNLESTVVNVCGLIFLYFTSLALTSSTMQRAPVHWTRRRFQ
jgi:hypothetical protein